MAAQVPAALKAADITRFAHRAAQLETAKPVISYWCDYWIVNQILSKGLHSTDQECLAYTMSMMDKLEKFKAENSTNDTVVDDIAGKAYVEQFGLETFQRADNAVRANKASRQTGDTFFAAATFLDLLEIWGPIEAEIAAKIKYAKYHATRILKAIKAGEDPNLSNPKPEPVVEEQLPPLDANDPDVRLLNGSDQVSDSAALRQPSVVEIPDETDHSQRHLAQQSHLNESLHPSRDPSLPREGDHKPSIEHIPDESHQLQSRLAFSSSLDQSLHPSRTQTPPAHDVSPLGGPIDPENEPTAISPISPEDAASDRKPSLGGNYFPVVPAALSQTPPPPPESPSHPTPTTFNLPSAPSDPSLPQPPSTFQPVPPLHTRSLPPEGPPVRSSPPPPARHHGHFLPPTQPIPPSLAPQSHPRQPIPQAPPQIHNPQSQQQQQGPSAYISSTASGVAPTTPLQAQPLPASVELDEVVIMQAQKHARFAISALNFEDVPTAVRELRAALRTLGAG